MYFIFSFVVFIVRDGGLWRGIGGRVFQSFQSIVFHRCVLTSVSILKGTDTLSGGSYHVKFICSASFLKECLH